MRRHPRLARRLEELRAGEGSLEAAMFDEREAALEWCEDALLERHGVALKIAEELPLSKHESLRDLSAEQLEVLTALMERQTFAAREMVVRKDDPANTLFFLVKGDLSVLSELPGGRLGRLATLSAGMGFGEPAIVEGAVRTAYVRADTPSVCWTLSRAAFDSLDASASELKIRLLQNLLQTATQTLGRLSFEALAEQR
jgi:glutaminase